MPPLGRLVVNSYRLPIVTIGVSGIIFACSDLSHMDGQAELL